MKDICENRHGGNSESVEANASMSTAKVIQGFRIAEFIHGCGERGATAEEVEIGLKMSRSSASARMSELKELGIVVPSSERRRTSSGRLARVIVHKAFAGVKS